jgi:hypothetical protein
LASITWCITQCQNPCPEKKAPGVPDVQALWHKDGGKYLVALF